MPYSTNNPPKRIGYPYAVSTYSGKIPEVFEQTINNNSKLWEYVTGDSLPVIFKSGYFSDGVNLGLTLGDFIICRLVPSESVEVLKVTNSLLGAVTADINVASPLPVPHPYYHFHGFAGNQLAGDSKFFDLAAGNHGLRGANLTDAAMFTTAGYISTVDPDTGVADSTLHLPNLNFDYAGGEKLIVWWLGSVAVEGANCPMMGDGWSTTAAQHGMRVRVIAADGKYDLSLWGGTQGNSGASHAAVFDGTLHSLAFGFDGANQVHGMWADEAYHNLFGSVYQPFGSGVAFDTTNSNTFNIGASRPSSAASATEADGIAVKTRALVIIRLPAAYTMPSVTTLTNVFSQLRANPGKLIQATAF